MGSKNMASALKETVYQSVYTGMYTQGDSGMQRKATLTKRGWMRFHMGRNIGTGP
jgi:hypothetical protein